MDKPPSIVRLPLAVTTIIHNLDSLVDEELCLALQKLWHYASNNQFRVSMGADSLGLFPILARILKTEGGNIYENALGCLWFLSRVRENKAKIGKSELGILPLLVDNFRTRNMYREVSMNILINCSLDGANHEQLFSDETGYYPLCVQSIIDQPDDIVLYISIANLVSALSDQYLSSLFAQNIIDFLYNKLILSGSNPERWERREGGEEYWSLTIIMDLSAVSPKARTFLRLFGKNTILMQIMNNSIGFMEGVKAACTLLNLYQHRDHQPMLSSYLQTSFIITPEPSHYEEKFIFENNSNLFESFCDHFPSFFPILLEMFEATLNCNNGTAAKKLQGIGFVYGIIRLKIITECLANLSFSISNRKYLKRAKRLIFLIVRALRLFLDNESQLFAFLGQICYAGGGGEDYDTLHNCLELLLQLSFPVDETQRPIAGTPKEVTEEEGPEWLLRNEVQLIFLLEKISNLPAERRIPEKTQMLLHCLLGRLKS
jgi:hypothetical protein